MRTRAKVNLLFICVLFIAHLSTQFAYADLPEQYMTFSAEKKLDFLMEEIKRSDYLSTSERVLPTQNPGMFDMLRLLTASFLSRTFSWTSDEIPPCRPKDIPKLIHTYGSEAAVEWIIDHDLGYTGLFKTGGIGIARLSIAKMGGSFTPGMGLKILIDGKPSVNFQVMYSLDGQGSDRNFFRNSFTNVINPPSGRILSFLAGRFEAGLRNLGGGHLDRPENATTLPLYEAAVVDRFGSEDQFKASEPYKVVFTPNPKVTEIFKVDRDYRLAMLDIPEGTVLYEISIQKTANSPIKVLGKLVTRSGFVASSYGDKILFFQHQARRNPN